MITTASLASVEPTHPSTHHAWAGGAFAALMVLALPACGDGLSGLARVVDGDTIAIGSQRIRLWGIDAPEVAQMCLTATARWYSCGGDATEHITRLIASRPVSCAYRDTDRYGRTVATCVVGGLDLGRAMVWAGWAVDYARYSHGTYQNAETEAQAAMRGMWQGMFIRPEEYRRAARR